MQEWMEDRMNEWMDDGWMMDGWMNGCMGRQMDG